MPLSDIIEKEDEEDKDLPVKDAIMNKDIAIRDVIVKGSGGVEKAAEEIFEEGIEDSKEELDKEKIRTEVCKKVLKEDLNLIFK